MTTLSFISNYLPNDCTKLLNGKNEDQWLDVLKKDDKKHHNIGSKTSKLFKAICVKTPNFQNNKKLTQVAQNLDSYLERHKKELSKKAKARFKEAHKKFVENNNANSKWEKKSIQIQQTCPLAKVSRDILLHIASFVVESGDNKFLNKENNLSLFFTCKEMNAHLLPFVGTKGKDKAFGDILRNVLVRQNLLPSKTLVPYGNGVKKLDLSGIQSRHENLLKRVAECFSNLEEIVLSGIAVNSFEPLENLKRLNSLSISHSHMVNLDPIFRIKGLLYLRIMHSSNVTDQTLEQIGTNLKSLVHLNLKETTGFTANGISHLAHLKLENLNLQRDYMWMVLDAASLPEIAKITTLTKLNICGHGHSLPTASIPVLASLTKLETLELNNTWNLTAADITNLSAALPQLKALSLKNSVLSDAVAGNLQLYQLQSLDLENCHLSDLEIGNILQLRNLTYLNISKSQNFTNQGLESITPLKKLKTVVLSRNTFWPFFGGALMTVPSAESMNYLREKIPGLDIKVA